MPVPNECVGLIIGKGGETIRQLQVESGAKMQVAIKESGNSGLRNVFIEGPPEKYEHAKRLVEAIVDMVKMNKLIDYLASEKARNWPRNAVRGLSYSK